MPSSCLQQSFRWPGRWFLAVFCVSLGLVGCDRKPRPDDPSPTSPPTALKTSSGDTSAAAPIVSTAAALQHLANDRSNPYLANNAKATLEAWNQHDYDQSIALIKVILSLRLTAEQQSSVLAALDSMRPAIDRAAQSGNASAKAAAARLGSFNAP